MLSRLFTIFLLAVASLRVNAASLTGVIITNEATSYSAVEVVAVDQVHTTIRSALADTVGAGQNQTEETRREALKTYRELAEKEPETYQPDVAATLNDLGIFDSDQNRIEKARKEFEEALKTYRELAHKEPDIYLRCVAITLNNLGILEGTPEPAGGGAENLPRAGAERARDLSALRGDNTQQPWDAR
jgi:tetratricopeptide (TPR) repeat protein